ncbi:MAG: peptidoglycan editing factor PgeF [Pseudomonadota bacterium]
MKPSETKPRPAPAHTPPTDRSAPNQPALQPIQAGNLAALPGIVHGFFTREGGVSNGIYAGLNCGRGSRDATLNVEDNRARVQAYLGADDLITQFQVHSAIAVITDEAWAPEAAPRADAIVTRRKGLGIGALAADCTPVLFAAPEAGVVAATHAGWKGAVAGVLEATVAKMVEAGAQASTIHAAIGPTISQANYEVGPEFEAQVTAIDPAFQRFFTVPAGKSRAHFDLPGFVEHRLQRCGLASVERQTPCTYADPERFYSYRRATHHGEDDYGRQISAIVLQ